MPEIDETQLANYRRLESLADAISKNPKARALLQEAAAIAVPEQVGPEIHLRREFNEGLTAIREELKAEREAREKVERERSERDTTSQLEARWMKGRATARESGYTNEGLEKLEKWMEDNNVADHRIAIPAFERENPPPTPIANGNSGRWDFFSAKDQEQPDIKALFDGDEDKFMGTAIQSALADVRNQRR